MLENGMANYFKNHELVIIASANDNVLPDPKMSREVIGGIQKQTP